MKQIAKDVVIIGGGPGGYVAGPILAAEGLSVACVEREVLGGTCLKWGCMPTKSLVSVSACIDKINHAETYGIKVGSWDLNFGKTMARTKGQVKVLEDGCISKFNKSGIDLFMGFGSFVDEHTVRVDPNEGEPFEIKAKHIIIDTGSSSMNIPPFNDDPDIMTNREALSMDNLPGTLLIIGGGVIGCEFANIFTNFGVKVTMVELMDRILPPVDADVADLMQKELSGMGVDIQLGTKVESYAKKSNGYTCILSNGKTIETEKIMVVVGRRPNSDKIQLGNTSIQTNRRGHILVDQNLRTAAEHIYAIGDVIGGTLAHVSRMEGEIVAKNILGDNIPMDYKVVPWSIFTNLEISGVGNHRTEGKGTRAVIFGFSLEILK